MTHASVPSGASGAHALVVAARAIPSFEVDDLDAVVRGLIARGVVFEESETPKTIDFTAQIGPARGAWFKDPAGNVLGLREGPVPTVSPLPYAAGPGHLG